MYVDICTYMWIVGGWVWYSELAREQGTQQVRYQN